MIEYKVEEGRGGHEVTSIHGLTLTAFIPDSDGGKAVLFALDLDAFDFRS